MFPELQEFVMSSKQCSLIRGVAIVKASLSLASDELQIRIFLSRCLIGGVFVFQNKNITFVEAQLVRFVLHRLEKIRML